jgi:hypothetical protein
MLVMAEMLLSRDTRAGLVVLPRRLRLWDRIAARLHAFDIDRELASGVPPETSVAHELRASLLISPSVRDGLAESLFRIANRRSRRPSVVRGPIAYDEARRAEPLLNRLTLRLRAPEPVAARGVAQLRVLLSDSTGPLFARHRGSELRASIERAMRDLEPETQS